jgi:hypothetical protein
MKLPLISSAFIVLALTTIARGQIDSISAPSDSFIDNVVDSNRANATAVDEIKKRGPVEARASFFAEPLARDLSPTMVEEVKPRLEPPENQPFWITKKISIAYGFNEVTSKLPDGAETAVNIAKTELYLEAKTGFSLTSGFTFQNLSKTDDLGNSADTDVYSFSVQPAQELFHVFDPQTKRPDQLVAGFGLGYSRFDSDSSGRTGASSSDADAYSISPNLVYLRPSKDKKTTLVIGPTYTMQWKETSTPARTPFSTNSGLFTLLGRVDRVLAKEWVVSLSATWKHDVNQDVAPGQTAVFRDWAECGVALRYQVCKSTRIKVGYSYEAFRSDFDTHKVAVTGEITF